MEWNPAQVRELLHLAADVKAHPDRYRGALAGRFLALIFEKPSLRTRVTFEVGIQFPEFGLDLPAFGDVDCHPGEMQG